MLMQERSVSGGSSRFGPVPVPIVLLLLVLLPIGPVGWLWGRADAKPRPRPASALAQIATRVGCRLDEFHDGSGVLLFENHTGMHAAMAATAYLSVMTCPRVDRRALEALAAFRDRRRAFGQSF